MTRPWPLMSSQRSPHLKRISDGNFLRLSRLRRSVGAHRRQFRGRTDCTRLVQALSVSRHFGELCCSGQVEGESGSCQSKSQAESGSRRWSDHYLLQGGCAFGFKVSQKGHKLHWELLLFTVQYFFFFFLKLSRFFLWVYYSMLTFCNALTCGREEPHSPVYLSGVY